jgi:folate-binding protein YgfZ
LHGPRAEEVLARVFPDGALPARIHEHVVLPLSAGGRPSGAAPDPGGSRTPGAAGVRVARARALAHQAFDLHVAADGASELRDRLLSAGGPLGLVLLEEDEHEILRIEAGRPALGREFSSETNPHEAGLLEDVSFTKGCYIGQEVVARLDTYEKVRRFLRGIRFDGVAAPAAGAALHAPDAAEGGTVRREAGRITSAACSPRVGKAIALAVLQKGFAEPGTRLEAASAGPPIAGEVVTLPFLPPAA